MLSHKLKEFARQNPEDDEFSAAHLNYKSIKVIDRIGSNFWFIEELYLNHNQLLSLSGIEEFRNLKVFHFRFNNIHDWVELTRITNPFFMESLAVTGNPFESDERTQYNYLHKNLFKNLVQFNPSCMDYYQKMQRESKSKRNSRVQAEPEMLTKRNHNKKAKTIVGACEEVSFDSLFTSRVKKSIINPEKYHRLSGSYTQEQSKNSLLSPDFHRRNASKKVTKSTEHPSSLEETKRFTNSFVNSSEKKVREDQHRVNPFIQQQQEDDPRAESYIRLWKKQEEEMNLSAETAKFSLGNVTKARGSTINKNFIEEQSQFLADAFYLRGLCEKIFKVWSQGGVGGRIHSKKLWLKGFASLKMNWQISKIQKEYSGKKSILLMRPIPKPST